MAVETDGTDEVSNLVVPTLRTAVPGIWGMVVSWLLTQVAELPDVLRDPLQTFLDDTALRTAAAGVLTALVIAGWYWLWRRLEPKVPNWLIRLVLGSVHAPVYPTKSGV